MNNSQMSFNGSNSTLKNSKIKNASKISFGSNNTSQFYLNNNFEIIEEINIDNNDT